MHNENSAGKVVSQENAGKPKFANIASKYQAAAAPVSEVQKPTVQEKSTVQEDKISVAAKNMTTAVKASADRNITGRRKHPAFKGDRIARTYKLPVDLDRKMDAIYEKEGIEKQALTIKALTKYIDEMFPEIA